MTVETAPPRFEEFQPDLYAQLRENDSKIRLKETSFVATTKEIKAMIQATEEEYWGGLWYELLQGALDYNDPERGLPEIIVYLSVPPGKVGFGEFMEIAGQGTFQHSQVSRVEVRNHLGDPKNGLKPTHIARMEHQQADDAQTLGEHGRGLSIASTAIVGSNLGASIDYCSRTPELGTWIGEGVMVKDEDDPSATPAFGLKYKKLELAEAEQTPFTTIGVNEPAPALVEALRRFPVSFLPASPEYRFGRLEHDGKTKVDNRLTIFVGDINRINKGDQSFSYSFGQRRFGLTLDDNIRETEPTRVEILPEAFAGNEDCCNYVYADGLRVKSEKKWALPWSFWGFKNANDESRIGRTNDSRRATNIPTELLVEVIKRAPADLLAQLIEANMGEQELTVEGEISRFSLGASQFDTDEKARFEVAWQSILEKMGLTPEEVLIASPESSLPDPPVHTDGRPILVIKSPAFLDAIWHSVGPQRSYQDILREERRQMEQELERQAEEHRKQIADLKQQEAQKRMEAIRLDRESRGITSEAKPTDEVIKVGYPHDPDVAYEMLMSQMLHELAFHEGMIVSNDGNGTVSFELNPSRFLQLPRNANDELQDLAPVFRTFIALMGEAADIEIRLVKGEDTVFYSFDRLKEIDRHGNISIAIKTGELVNPGHDLVRINMRARPIEVHGNEKELKRYQNFHSELLNAIHNLLGADKRIDYRLYSESPYGQNNPALAARIQMRAELDKLLEMQTQLVSKYGSLLEKRRKQHGLTGRPGTESPAYGIDHTRLVQAIQKEREQYKPPSMPDYRTKKIEEAVTNKTDYSDALWLVNPNSYLGLSRRGKKAKEHGDEEANAIAERLTREALQTALAPDFTLYTGRNCDIIHSGYLISHLSPEFSAVQEEAFVELPLPKSRLRMEGRAAVTFSKRILSKKSPLVHPPGFRPVAYYHPDPSVKITFHELPGRKMYTFESASDIEKGLVFYYEPDYSDDTTEPDDRETARLVRDEELSEGWKSIVTTVRFGLQSGEISPKTATDILLHAWNRSFTYSDTQDVFDRYKNLEGVAFIEKIINEAEGNCGYAARGFTGLCKAVGLPVREVGSFLTGTGHFNMSGNYHAMNEVYMGGKWVLVEPQSSYVDRAIKSEQLRRVPIGMRQEIEAAMKKLPTWRYNYVQMLREAFNLDGLNIRGGSDTAPVADITEVPVPDEDLRKAKEKLNWLQQQRRAYQQSTKDAMSLYSDAEEVPIREVLRRHWKTASALTTSATLFLLYAGASGKISFAADVYGQPDATPLSGTNSPELLAEKGADPSQWGSALEQLHLYVDQLSHYAAANHPQLATTLSMLGMTAAMLGGTIAVKESIRAKVANIRLRKARGTIQEMTQRDETDGMELREAIARETELRVREELHAKWEQLQEQIREELAEIERIEQQFAGGTVQ